MLAVLALVHYPGHSSVWNGDCVEAMGYASRAVAYGYLKVQAAVGINTTWPCSVIGFRHR
jgi:hypothetical protein